MAQNYGKDQSAGFSNRIEKVAIVGVSKDKYLMSFEAGIYC